MDRRQFLLGSAASLVAWTTMAQAGVQISTLSDDFFTMPSAFLARESDQTKANGVSSGWQDFADCLR